VIVAATDVARRVYKEETPLDEQIVEGICDAMTNGSKEKASKLTQKIGKLVVVANPILKNK